MKETRKKTESEERHSSKNSSKNASSDDDVNWCSPKRIVQDEKQVPRIILSNTAALLYTQKHWQI